MNSSAIKNLRAFLILLFCFSPINSKAQIGQKESCSELRNRLEKTREEAHQQCLDGCKPGDAAGLNCDCAACEILHGPSAEIDSQVERCTSKSKLTDASNYKLSRKSLEQLKEFQEDLRLWGLLETAVTFAPFASAFSSTNALDTAYSLSSTDWEVWAGLVSKLPAGKRGLLTNKCQYILLSHTKANRREDAKFWKAMCDSI